MAFHRPIPVQGAAWDRARARTLLVVAAVIVLFVVLTAKFSVQRAGPSFEIVPDAAAGLGLPFQGRPPDLPREEPA